MSRISPSLALLRAFAAPRPAVCRCARYTSAYASAPYTTAASTTAPSTTAPTSSLAALEAATQPNSVQPPSKSSALKTAARAAKTVSFTPATQPQFPSSPPRYHVARSQSKNLPVYTDYKRGGNLHLTTVRKVTGDLHALRDELRAWLAKKDDHVTVNSLTQHVVVKGHHREQIAEFLSRRGM